MLASMLVIVKWDGWSSLCHRNARLPSFVGRGVVHLLIVPPEDKKHLTNLFNTQIMLWLHCQLPQPSRSLVQDSLSFRTKMKIFLKRKCVYIHILDNYKKGEFIMNWHKNIKQIVVTKLWIWFNYRKFREQIVFVGLTFSKYISGSLKKQRMPKPYVCCSLHSPCLF